MWFIQPVPDDAADGVLSELYDQDLSGGGYITNITRVWSQRPEMMALWTQLIKSVRSHLRLQTFELVTLAASHAIGCVY
jgi:hypothetical protein